MLVQVYKSLAETQTWKRETGVLSEAMKELDLKTGTIVTRNEDERIDTGEETIEGQGRDRGTRSAVRRYYLSYVEYGSMRKAGKPVSLEMKKLVLSRFFR